MDMIGLTRNVQAISRSAGVFLAIVAGAGEPLVPRPEIVGVETADAHTLVLLVRNDANHPVPSQNAIDYAVDGQRPAAVGRFSATLYEAKAEGRNDVFPQLVLHRLYLRLRTSLEEGHRYSIRSPAGSTSWGFRTAVTVCESLKYNQNGYHPGVAQRFAFFAPWLGDLGATTTPPPARFQVVKADGTGVVLESQPVQCDGERIAGAPVWRLDFSALTNAGQYRLVLPGVGSSEPFGVGDRWSHHAFYVHLKVLYHQRCGVPLQAPYTRWERDACHTNLGITDAEPPEFIPASTPVQGTLRGGALYERVVREQMFPAFDQVPLGRRYTDGWSLIMQNEYAVYDTLAPNAFLHACLAPDVPLKGELLPYGQARPPGGYPVLRQRQP